MWLNALTKDAVVALKGEDGVNNGEGILDGCYAEEENEREVDDFEYEEEEERIQTRKSEAKEDAPESVYAPSLVGRESTPQAPPDVHDRRKSMIHGFAQGSGREAAVGAPPPGGGGGGSSRARQRSAFDLEHGSSSIRNASQAVQAENGQPSNNAVAPRAALRRSSVNVLAIPDKQKYDESGHVRKASPPLPPLHQQHAENADEEARGGGSVRPGTGVVHVASRNSSSHGSRPSNSRASTRMRTPSKER